MPGLHALKKHCFKMKDTGLYKKSSRKNSCSFKKAEMTPYEKHCFKHKITDSEEMKASGAVLHNRNYEANPEKHNKRAH